MGDWLVGLWIEQLQPILVPIWESTQFWRLLSLTMLVAGALIAWPLRRSLVRLLTRPERVEHDRRVFKASGRVVGEIALERFLGNLIASHDCRSNDLQSAQALVDFFRRPGNQFLSRRISARAAGLAADLRSVLDFISGHFFASPQAPTVANFRAALEPELNPDTSATPSPEASTKYHSLARELVLRCRSAEAKFASYRQTVKDVLAL